MATTDNDNDGDAPLIGDQIKEIRWMTDEEEADEFWGGGHQRAPVIVMESGYRIYPSQDPEGNGPGALFGINPDDCPVHLQPSGSPDGE